MPVHVCVLVCMCVCVYIYIHTLSPRHFAYKCVTRMYVCIYIYMYIYIHIRMRLTHLTHKTHTQAEALRHDYGGMSSAILAGMVHGTPWGIPLSSADTAPGLAHSQDLTALGWAMLISRCMEAQGR
jgi:hypothetical protein